MHKKTSLRQTIYHEPIKIVMISPSYIRSVQDKLYEKILLYWLSIHFTDDSLQRLQKEVNVDIPVLFFEDGFLELRRNLDAELSEIHNKSNTVLIITDPCIIMGELKKTWNYCLRISANYKEVYISTLSCRYNVVQLKALGIFPDGRHSNAQKYADKDYEAMIDFLSTQKTDGTYPTRKECTEHFNMKSATGLNYFIRNNYDCTVTEYLKKIRDRRINST